MSWVFFVAALAASVLSGAAGFARAEEADCTAVVAAIHRFEARRSGKAVTAGRLAKRLGVTPEAVIRCAEAYGRRVRVAPGGEAKAEIAPEEGAGETGGGFGGETRSGVRGRRGRRSRRVEGPLGP